MAVNRSVLIFASSADGLDERHVDLDPPARELLLVALEAPLTPLQVMAILWGPK